MAAKPQHPFLQIDQAAHLWILSSDFLESGLPHPPIYPGFVEPRLNFPAYYFVNPPKEQSNTSVVLPAPVDYYDFEFADRLNKRQGYELDELLDWHFEPCSDRPGFIDYVNDIRQRLSYLIVEPESRSGLHIWIANAKTRVGQRVALKGSAEDAIDDANVPGQRDGSARRELSHREAVALLLLLNPELGEKALADVPRTTQGEIVGDLIHRSYKRTEDYLRYAGGYSQDGPFTKRTLLALQQYLQAKKAAESPLGKAVEKKLQELDSKCGK